MLSLAVTSDSHLSLGRRDNHYFDYDSVQQSGDRDSESCFSIQQFLNQSRAAEETRLRRELADVERQLSRREELREQALSDLESKLDWYVERLELVYRRPGSQKEKQEALKQQIQDFYQQIRSEKRRAWKDAQELESERRRLRSELSDLKDTDIVTKLLDDVDFEM